MKDPHTVNGHPNCIAVPKNRRNHRGTHASCNVPHRRCNRVHRQQGTRRVLLAGLHYQVWRSVTFWEPMLARMPSPSYPHGG